MEVHSKKGGGGGKFLVLQVVFLLLSSSMEATYKKIGITHPGLDGPYLAGFQKDNIYLEQPVEVLICLRVQYKTIKTKEI